MDKERKGKEERKRNIGYFLHTPYRGWVCNLCMCPDKEPNQPPLGAQGHPTNWAGRS